MKNLFASFGSRGLIWYLLSSGSPAFGQGLVSVVPKEGAAGTALKIEITGTDDTFFSEDATVAFFPAMEITHGPVSWIDSNRIDTTISILPDTPPGLQSVTISANSVSFSGADLFTVTRCTTCGTPTIIQCDPISGSQGETLPVMVTGKNTYFDQTSQLAFSGGGIQAVRITVSSATVLVASIAIARDAATGPRNVTVTTGNENAEGDDLFSVLSLPLAIDPDHGAQGTSLTTITVSGGPGGYSSQTKANLGDGIQVGSVASPDGSVLVLADVVIAQDAAIGPHDLVLSLPKGNQTFPKVFDVTLGAETRLLSINPNHVDQAHPGLPITIIGENARFDSVEPKVSFSVKGLVASDITSKGRNDLDAVVATEFGAPEGPADLTVELCPERGAPNCPALNLPRALTITPAGTLTSVVPGLLKPGDDLLVTIAGSDCRLIDGKTVLLIEPDQGLQVTSLTVIDVDHLTAQISVAAGATGTPRGLRAVTETEVAWGKDLLDVENPEITGVVPAGANPGLALVRVTISGIDIPFDASTEVSFLPPDSGVTVSAVRFDPSSLDRVVADVTVAATAAPGPRDVRVKVGSVDVTGAKAFSVFAPTQPKKELESGCGCGAEVPSSSFLFFLFFVLPLVRSQRRPPATTFQRALSATLSSARRPR